MRCLYCENPVDTWDAGTGAWVACPHCGCRYSYTILAENILQRYWAEPERWHLDKGVAENGLPYVYVTDTKALSARWN